MTLEEPPRLVESHRVAKPAQGSIAIAASTAERGRISLRIRGGTVACVLVGLVAVGCGGSGAEDAAETSGNADEATLDLSSLSVGIAQRDIDAADLFDSATGGVFAINTGLDAVTLFEMNAVEGGSGIEVLDRSADIAPPWDTFEGSEMASVGHGRSGSDHALVIAENHVSGQILTASSIDDGATWETALSADTRCGSHDQRTYVINGNVGSVSYEACDSGTPGLLWQAPLGSGIELTGAQLPIFTYTDTMCSTDEVAVLLHDEYDSNAAGDVYTLWTSGDGVSWRQIDVPGSFSTPQFSDQKWLSCTGDGFIAAAESSGWLFAADASFVSQFDTPEGADGFSVSHGYLFAWGFGIPLQISNDAGVTWNGVVGNLGDVTDAAASADGHVWILSDGDLYSSASADPVDDDIDTRAGMVGRPAGTAGRPQGNLDAPPFWMCVSGVADDDTLNLRSGPGVSNGTVHQIPPRWCDIYATGREAQVGDSTWIEVDFYDHLFHAIGWANSAYLREEPNPCYWEIDGCGL